METVWTIGYGADHWEEFLGRLEPWRFTHLVDVRTNPYSRYQEDFRGEDFAHKVQAAGMKYVFMGDRIGGKPTWPEVHTEGVLDRDKLAKDARFIQGIEAVMKAAEATDRRMCLMCGCAQPHECHRGRILGESLRLRGLELVHILPDGSTAPQSETRLWAGLDQGSLF